MPVNRNALIRFKTIDICLQNRYRQWTLKDLIDACSEALYEYEGIDKGVSRRTIQADIQLMRSDKLGYNAPIVVIDRKYYTYEDADYSITNIPLTDQDLDKLSEVMEILRQFKGFSHFQALDGMVQKLEDHIHSKKNQQQPIIDFEKNEQLKGLEYLDVLYQAILKKQVLEVSYQSFKAKKANTQTFHPYLLKEFNNRWFVLGSIGGTEKVSNLALDRIHSIETDSTTLYVDRGGINANDFYKDVVGVTVSENVPVHTVLLRIDLWNAPYLLTKPMHHSQKVVERSEESVTVSLEVQHNFELEREILGYGDALEVLEPRGLRNRIAKRLEKNFSKYAN